MEIYTHIETCQHSPPHTSHMSVRSHPTHAHCESRVTHPIYTCTVTRTRHMHANMPCPCNKHVHTPSTSTSRHPCISTSGHMQTHRPTTHTLAHMTQTSQTRMPGHTPNPSMQTCVHTDGHTHAYFSTCDKQTHTWLSRCVQTQRHRS